MSGPLVLFPNRVAIGNAGGVPVYMTPEFSRALAALLERVGGENSIGLGDLALETALASSGVPASVAPDADPFAAAGLMASLQDLQHQVATMAGQLAALSGGSATSDDGRPFAPSPRPDAPDDARPFADLQRAATPSVDDARAFAPPPRPDASAQSVEVAPPTDWEHPGKVGAASPNSGAFTTLATTAKTSLNPTGADVEIKPTGAGKAVIAPAATGTMDNVTLGGATPAAATVTTLATTGSATIGAAVALGAPLSPVTYHAGYSTTAQYRFMLNHPGAGVLGIGSDGVASMILGIASASTGAVNAIWAKLGSGGLAVTAGFGCNGKTAQTAFALGAAATDLASVITLANNLRSMAVANGSGA